MQKLDQRNKTIHQLTHHLHSLQGCEPTNRSIEEQRGAQFAADINHEMSNMAPAPWDSFSPGHRGNRMNLSTRPEASGLVYNGYEGNALCHADVAFTHTMTSTLPPYRSNQVVLPSASPYHSVRLTKGDGEGQGPHDTTGACTNLNREENDEILEILRSHSPHPAMSTRQSLSMPPVSPYSALTIEGRGLVDRNKSSGERFRQSESEEEEKGSAKYGDFAPTSRSPITPSAHSYGQTLVLPWQNPFIFPIREENIAKESSARLGDVPGTVDLVRNQVNLRKHTQKIIDKDIGNDCNSQSSITSVPSVLTTGTNEELGIRSHEDVRFRDHKGITSGAGEIGSTPWKKERDGKRDAFDISRVRQSCEY